MLSIKIMPGDLANNFEKMDSPQGSFKKKIFPQEDRITFLGSGKDCIHAVAKYLNLSRSDEVFITTTTDSPFVSSCVTCTLFNYCKVSRVFTEKTKLIYIIHEFGFPNPRLLDLIELGKQKGIPVFEDSAHSFDTLYNGLMVGTLGDFGMYSMPKSFPVKRGGVLYFKKNQSLFHQRENEFSEIREIFFNSSKYLEALTQRRRLIYRKYKDAFSEEEIFRFTGSEAPFIFAFKSSAAKIIYQELDQPHSGVELVRTHNKDWVALPTNPFLDDKSVYSLIDKIYQYL